MQTETTERGTLVMGRDLYSEAGDEANGGAFGIHKQNIGPETHDIEAGGIPSFMMEQFANEGIFFEPTEVAEDHALNAYLAQKPQRAE